MEMKGPFEKSILTYQERGGKECVKGLVCKIKHGLLAEIKCNVSCVRVMATTSTDIMRTHIG